MRPGPPNRQRANSGPVPVIVLANASTVTRCRANVACGSGGASHPLSRPTGHLDLGARVSLHIEGSMAGQVPREPQTQRAAKRGPRLTLIAPIPQRPRRWADVEGLPWQFGPDHAASGPLGGMSLSDAHGHEGRNCALPHQTRIRFPPTRIRFHPTPRPPPAAAGTCQVHLGR
jgi:hypothetical protein